MAESAELLDLLDFLTPNVGYEDEKHRDVCGCCGTYYVISPSELADVKKRVLAMYKALKKVTTIEQSGAFYDRYDALRAINIAKNALALIDCSDI